MTSTLIYSENDAVLVDPLTTVAEAEALAAWVNLHHRNLTTLYITHGHLDHFGGLSVLLRRFPGARTIATPKTMELARQQPVEFYHRLLPGQLPDFSGLKEEISTYQELFNTMGRLYPYWAAHQAWLMFGLA
ncbi:MBL fold metallo-hydrolase [Arthrobacter sp. NPDC058097]|uniref:MBL fold metallo-hydrolase n=1 Tax=Arthrobacter sp. NPDC058097 TaxID=3346340 RepID=UPI0036D7896F